MSRPHSPRADKNRVLVKLRPSASLGLAETRANLRPLYEPSAPSFRLGAGEPGWYVADLPDGAESPWDLAHARVADQLGVSESDVLYAEPDIIHDIYPDPAETPSDVRFEIGAECAERIEQDPANKKAVGPDRFAWHLGDEFSQLGRARAAVRFSDPRTRIAHIDTGYYPRHVTTPAHVRTDLERNFVERDGSPDSAEDPNNRVFLLDNSGHGTGTIGILAGSVAASYGDEPLGAAPDAEVVPLRVADRVVLLRTSAFAEALRYSVDAGCHVVTISMGGLPMRAWREAVDRAYLAGVCVVAAAGNNIRRLPTRNVVYPARYGRVIAACGVMADGRPYSGLARSEMQGNHGPGSVMGSALGAYTPNIPWPVFGCEENIRLNGAGTSSATPQIAAAAALWLEKYKADLRPDWRRVEAVRYALFHTAKEGQRAKLGEGILQAARALEVRPRLDRPQTKSDRDSFAALRVITGLGVAEAPPREQMFELELTQRWLLNREIQRILPDPDRAASLDTDELRKLMEAIIEDPGASRALRRHVAARYPVVTGRSAPSEPSAADAVPPVLRETDLQPEPQDPPHRKLRVFALDPSLSGRLETASIDKVTLNVRWEALKPGPVGEYLAVDDEDASGRRYDGVHLDDRRLLAQDGWAPSEGNPQFHQQMVYAVTMKTIEHFELALGRPVLWRPAHNEADPSDESGFVQQLTIRPHALRQPNAYYSPRGVALEFGYFEAAPDTASDLVPGSRVYACLSHDIIVHEATHAILDGMHRHFNRPSNPDVLALHEGFADIVALMQHFTMPELLRREVGRARGDLEAETLLGGLAVQFGQAVGRGGALREAIGRMEDGVWRRLDPDPAELRKRLAPHSRGAILVAAVFDAFLAIYKARTADLLRIATRGTGVLPSGALHPDLVNRLADEATKSAAHVLSMCIRALDYLPPVDVTFFEYLRALITADHDLVRDDRHNYRVAFVEAFRRRGIYPMGHGRVAGDAPRTLSVDTLLWQGFDLSRLAEQKDGDAVVEQYERVVDLLRGYADACTYIGDREVLFKKTNATRRELEDMLIPGFEAVPAFARELGIDPGEPFVVDELRRAARFGPDGRYAPQLIVSLTQEVQATSGDHTFSFPGGSTLVIDLTRAEVKYRIVKNIMSEHRRERTAEFSLGMAVDPLRALLLGAAAGGEPFAALHTLAGDHG